MKVIIAGSRDVTDYSLIQQAVKSSGYEIRTVVSGGARGVDKLGERYADEHDLHLEVYPAEWRDHDDMFNPKAGFERNQLMAENADALIAITMGTPGTTHMIKTARKMGLEVYVKEVPGYL